MISLLCLILIITPDPFTGDDFFEALNDRDISVVNRAEMEKRNGAETCTMVVTSRSARFATCIHATAADARRVAYGRSDYTRSVFQRGTVVVYLRKGANSRLRESVIDVMGTP